jgi:threonine synthase
VKYLKCSRCGRVYRLEEKPVMCVNRDLGRLDIVYDYDAIREAVKPSDLANREASMWRYREFLPLPNDKFRVSLGEGWTPLIKAERLAEKIGLRNLYLKDETRNPTGSFKDRAMSVSVSMARYFGFKRAVVASSGNGQQHLGLFRKDLLVWMN